MLNLSQSAVSRACSVARNSGRISSIYLRRARRERGTQSAPNRTATSAISSMYRSARAGLNVRPGYEVRVRGVPVGTIKAIKIDRRDFSATYVLALDPHQAIAAERDKQVTANQAKALPAAESQKASKVA